MTTRATLGRTELSTPDDLTIEMTRSYAAPLELVWRLWNDPERVAEYWGPRDHRNEVEEYDVRVGGKWRITSHMGEGGSVSFHGEFLQVIEHELIEWTFGFDDVPPAPETLWFSERDGVTTLRSHSKYPSREIRDGVLGTGMLDGATEMHDKFGEMLDAEQAG